MIIEETEVQNYFYPELKKECLGYGWNLNLKIILIDLSGQFNLFYLGGL